jgi:hypothetical protein
MNVEIETETLIFFFWEYLFRNFGILSLQCVERFLYRSCQRSYVRTLVGACSKSKKDKNWNRLLTVTFTFYIMI